MACPSPKPSRLSVLAAIVARRRWSVLIVIGIVVALWAPRLRGPIDLRYDAGVYYLLGTSLAEGHGYRISSEPGAPEAIQYPPVLPALVALHEKVLGTTEPMIVGSWLRRTYAGLSIMLGLTLLALARSLLPPILALGATVLALLQAHTLLLSDMLFAELPFTIVALGFLIVLRSERLRSHPRARETVLFGLGTAGFLLRLAGIALLATWVLEACVRRAWTTAALRVVLALLPFGAWQFYVARVRASDAYQHPAYAYQRAPYQFYNVTYGENMTLADPFHPEAGVADFPALVRRWSGNLFALPTAIGECVSAPSGLWRPVLGGAHDDDATHDHRLNRAARFPLVVLAGLVCAGFVLLASRGEWGLVLFTAGSIAIVCTTPWPQQFSRYLSPVAPCLAIAFVLGAAATLRACIDRGSRRVFRAARLVLIGLCALCPCVQIFAAAKLIGYHEREGFFVDGHWWEWFHAANWLRYHAPPGSVVATAEPHLLYLRTGLPAIFPPHELDADKANALLEQAGVAYVLVDTFEFLDMSQRYAAPALERRPETWQLVREVGNARIYVRRAVSAATVSATPPSAGSPSPHT